MCVIRRDILIAAVLVALSGCFAAGIVLWRPAVAQNDPYRSLIARWTVDEVPGNRTFVGLGSFLYREEWNGPAQAFAGPVLLQVAEADYPVRFSVTGQVTIADHDELTLTTEAVASQTAPPATQEITLEQGEIVALPADTPFQVTTGPGEVVRLTAIAILPGGPPQTPGVEQAEWRAWGTVTPTPDEPLVVSMVDISLTGGESYRFQRDYGPALLYMEGLGEGTQPVALALSKGRGSYMRINENAPFTLKTPVSYLAVQTPVPLNRERAFETQSGAFLMSGTQARLRNRGLVDGSGVILVTFDGPNVVPLPPTPTARASPAVSPTASPAASPVGDGSG
jgi:hypothetical protein